MMNVAFTWEGVEMKKITITKGRIFDVVLILMIIVLCHLCSILHSRVILLESQAKTLSEIEGHFFAHRTKDVDKQRKYFEDRYNRAVQRADEASVLEKMAILGFSHDIHCAKLTLEAFDKSIERQKREAARQGL